MRLLLWAGSAPFALKAGGAATAGTLVPKDDASLAKVVGGHFNEDPVAHDRPDAEFAHPASRIGDDPMVVFKHDAETTIGQDFVDLAFEGQEILFGQRIKPIRG